MKNKKVVLIFPPYPIPKVFPKRTQVPLGIAYLAGTLREKGFAVQVIDSLVDGWENSKVIGGKYVQHGLSLEDIMDRVKQINPDVVGLSCMFGIQLKNTLCLADMIKQWNNDMFVVVGGAHASAEAERIMENKSIDCVVLGEGEETLISLLEGSIEATEGVIYRDSSGKVVTNERGSYIENLDNLPYPARDMFPMEKYFKINRPHGTISKHNRSTSIVTSRGCPAKCIFCAIHSVWGRSFRSRSPESVVDEIAHLQKEYGIKEFQIEDDNMTFDAERAEKICDLILERGIKANFTTPNGVAIWALNKELLAKMKRAGFYRLTLAVESGSNHTLKNIIRKPLSLEKVEYIVNEAIGLGFEVDTFFVIGFPGETPEEMKKTFKLARRLKVDSVKYFIATPYAGTDLYDIAKKKNLLVEGFNTDEYSVNPTQATMGTEYFTAKQIERIWFKETCKMQVLLFLRKPFSYIKDIFSVYFKKDFSSIFQVCRGFLKRGAL